MLSLPVEVSVGHREVVIWVSYLTETLTVGLTSRWRAGAALGAERCLAAGQLRHRESCGLVLEKPPLALGLRLHRSFSLRPQGRERPPEHLSDIWDGFCVRNKAPGPTLTTHLCE